MSKRKIVIIGAGPIGLETALRAATDGYDVTVIERGKAGEAVNRWGHVRMFTPFRMNSSESGRRVSGCRVDLDALLTGKEFRQSYLEPLAACPLLDGRVLTEHRLIAAGRTTLHKHHAIGSPRRSQDRFRLLVQTEQGSESVVTGDILIDCSGFTERHRFIGAGGIPCPGEIPLLRAEDYYVPDICGGREADFKNRHTLVVGSGYSAATSVVALERLQQTFPETRISWITRPGRSQPVSEIPGDPLPERVRLTEAANRCVHDDRVNWLPGAAIDRVSRHGMKYRVSLSWADSDSHIRRDHLSVDRIIANTGFRPNPDPFQELQIHRCYATEGPIKLAAHLLGQTSPDCLQQQSAGSDLLTNPEPDFFILGSASYARDNRFLIQTGLQQIDTLFSALNNSDVL